MIRTDSLPSDVLQKVFEAVGFRGKYLFLGPVCKEWWSRSSKYDTHTNFRNLMDSPSTMRESVAQSKGEPVLSKRNAWGYLARHLTPGNVDLAYELVRLIGWDEFSICPAGKCGNRFFFHWLSATGLKWDPDLAMASSTSLKFFKFMYLEKGHFPDYKSIARAARIGSVKLLRWLRTTGCDLTDVTEILAEEGHLETLIWANTSGLIVNQNTLQAAIYGKHAETILYIEDCLKSRPWCRRGR